MREVLNIYVRGVVCGQPRPSPIRRGDFVRMVTLDHYPKDHKKAGQLLPWVIWKRRVADHVRSQVARMDPIVGPIRLDLDFYFERPAYMLSSKYRNGEIPHIVKPDDDNCKKLVQDALTNVWAVGVDVFSGIWKDDCQVHRGEVTKWWVARDGIPGARIVVTAMEEAEATLFEDATWICCGKQIPLDIKKCPHCGTFWDAGAAASAEAAEKALAEKPVRPIRPTGRPVAPAAAAPEIGYPVD